MKQAYTPGSVGMKHSTPNNLGNNQVKTSWISKLDDTNVSLEGLRDATVARDKSDLSMEQLTIVRNSTKLLAGSAQKLTTIQESTIQDESFHGVSSSDSISNQLTNRNLTQVNTEEISKPKIDLTEDVITEDNIKVDNDLEEALSRKVAEIEYMTQLLNEKDDMIENLQDNIEDVQAQLEELKTTEEANKEVLEKAREDEDKLIEAKNDLIEANMKIQELEKKSFGHADQTLVEELKALREENQDRIRGMENLHGIIESSQKLLEDKKIEIANLESKVEELNSKVSQSDDALKSLEDKKME